MTTEEREHYRKIVTDYAKKNYRLLFREPQGQLNHQFIVPGSHYQFELWDWDSWLTDWALTDIVEEDISSYEKGCILNFLEHLDSCGRMPIVIMPERACPPFDKTDDADTNSHKPCLAQHARFICEKYGDASWLKDHYFRFRQYLDFYFERCFHKETGLYFWIDDCAIGVDNDPSIFYRPKRSSGSIYLNCLMYKELGDMAWLASQLGHAEDAAFYQEKADALKAAIRENCWDERDGFYYSVDLNLLPVDTSHFLHSGRPRTWHCLIQRIGVWVGFLAMWTGIATPEEAKRMVEEHYKNEKTFASPNGIRSLSKAEKMYGVYVSGNPSCWLGPIWGIANYLTFRALLAYGYKEEAVDLADKTLKMFGQDIEENGEMHEYYDPDTGKGVHNKGFQSWNLLVVTMANWLRDNA